MEDLRVPVRVGRTILNALQGGVVPRTGLGYIAVGREREITSLLSDLELIETGGATFRIIMGKYGSGKTFLLQTFKEYALSKGFIVADADLSPERNLVGNPIQKRGLHTYQELMANLSIKTSPTGNALEKILDYWMNSMWMQAAQKITSGSISGALLEESVSQMIEECILETTNFAYGFDLAAVLKIYWNASREKDFSRKRMALRWLRGEYPTRQSAKKDLGVMGIIDDDNWFDYIKNLSIFFHKIGYKGFVILIDELINLYKCRQKATRDKNYEKLLGMYNDCMQGKANYLGIVLGGTPISITDTDRGLYSYGALQSRLETGFFDNKDYNNVGPVLVISQLNKTELVILLEKILQIHQDVFSYKCSLKEKDIIYFLETVLKEERNLYITPRSIIRDFIMMLETLKERSDTNFNKYMLKIKASTDQDEEIG